MQTRGPMMRHWRLVNQMARITETDLVTAFEEGRLSSDAWAGMVNACRGCAWAGSCAGWLNDHDRAEAAPSSCCNRARFAALRDGQSLDA